MDRFSLDNLLRYTFAGGMTAITLLLTYPCAVNALPKDRGLTGEAAVVKLMIVLGRTKDLREVRASIEQDLAGERTVR